MKFERGSELRSGRYSESTACVSHVGFGTTCCEVARSPVENRSSVLYYLVISSERSGGHRSFLSMDLDMHLNIRGDGYSLIWEYL